MDLEQAEVHAFFYAKVVELDSFESASKFVEYLSHEDKWVSKIMQPSDNLHIGTKYRIKPETVTHPGGEYAAPISDTFGLIGKTVYEPSLAWSCNCWSISFKRHAVNTEYEALCFSSSKMHHLTKEAALEHAKVMYGDRS